MCTTRFNLNIVQEKFKTSLLEGDDVNMSDYLQAYEELNKFFESLGSMFSFVTAELTSKMEIIRNYRSNNNVAFSSVKTMIDFEKDLLKKSGYVSGCRTLLLLHRALDFIRLFLKSIGELQDHENTGPACRNAYNSTLGNHHSFFIANGARLAMYALPTKANLLIKVCGNDEEFQNCTLAAIPMTLDNIDIVYNRIHKLYTLHNLLNLP